MSFSYQYGANPAIDYPRFLVSDTQAANHVFEDQEILMATQIEAGVFQSGQFWNTGQGVASLSAPPTPWRRIAANLLDALAGNAARLGSVTQLLDVHLAPGLASQRLREQAQALRDADDNSGAFVIIEQVNNVFSFRDRFWATVMRQSGV